MEVFGLVKLGTQAGHAVLFPVVLKWNEEEAIVSVYAAKTLPQLWCPLARLVRPVACPFTAAPRIAQLEQSDLLSIVDELMNRDN